MTQKPIFLRFYFCLWYHEQMNKSSQKLRILYDGGCHLCHREIEHYRQVDTNKKLELIDITNSGFQAEKWGLDDKTVRKYFHVVDENDQLFVGVDAFAQIWQRLDYKWLHSMAHTQPLRSLMKASYLLFAEIRPLLPRKNNCSTNCCQI